MSALSSADLTRMQDTIEAVSLMQTCDIYRSPAAASNKVAALAVSSSGVVCEIAPISDATRMVAPPAELAGGRLDAIGYFLSDADLSVGDELRQSGVKYKVLGLGRWSTLRAAALQRLEA